MCGVGGLALVGDIGHKSGLVVSSEGDSLEAAVGQLHVVGAAGHVSVAGLVVAEVVAGVVVLDGVGEVVGHPWLLVVRWGWAVLGWTVGAGRGGNEGGGGGSQEHNLQHNT